MQKGLLDAPVVHRGQQRGRGDSQNQTKKIICKLKTLWTQQGKYPEFQLYQDLTDLVQNNEFLQHFLCFSSLAINNCVSVRVRNAVYDTKFLCSS